MNKLTLKSRESTEVATNYTNEEFKQIIAPIVDLICHDTILVDILDTAWKLNSMQKLNNQCSIDSIVSIYCKVLSASNDVKKNKYIALEIPSMAVKLLEKLILSEKKLHLHLWIYLKKLGIFEITNSLRESSSKDKNLHEIAMSTLFLFCSLVYYQIIALDDDSLFGDRNGDSGGNFSSFTGDSRSSSSHNSSLLFSIQELIDIVHILKQYLYQIIWVESYLQVHYVIS